MTAEGGGEVTEEKAGEQLFEQEQSAGLPPEVAAELEQRERPGEFHPLMNTPLPESNSLFCL